MEASELKSWIFGIVVFVLLVALHWYAYRVGERRQRRKSGADPSRRVISKEPLTPE